MPDTQSQRISALEVARSLLRIRQLFIALFLGPVVIGSSIIILQSLLSLFLVQLINEKPDDYGSRVRRSLDSEFLRELLFHERTPLPEPRICLPSEDCTIHTTDAVIQVSEPELVDPALYRELFRGATKQVHICKDCVGNLTLQISPQGNKTLVRSIEALGVMALVDSARNADASQHLVDFKTTRRRFDTLRGALIFQPTGLSTPLVFSDLATIMAIIVNVSLTAAVILWLTIRAHRRILDYFAKNDVLLPLVAGCGKDTVYRALWLLTLSRVIAFLIAALVPLLGIMTLSTKLPDSSSLSLPLHFVTLWIAAVLSALGIFGVSVSLAELKQRFPIQSFLHKIGPLIIWVVGSILWVIALLEGGPLFTPLAAIISHIPIVGLTPVLFAPIGTMSEVALVIHGILAAGLTLVTLRYNASWFAKHIEEV